MARESAITLWGASGKDYKTAAGREDTEGSWDDDAPNIGGQMAKKWGKNP